MKDTKMDVPIVKKFTRVKNAPLHKSHVLRVKELIITPLSVNFFIVTQQVVPHQKEEMKKAIQELKEAPVKKKKKDISHIQCFRCRNMGHYANMRSEEHRVGKECRSRWSPY